MHIIGTNTGNCVWLITVHIDQSLKAVFLTTVKQPVNRAFLINLAMVRIEITQEIIPNHILRLTFATQSVGNKLQVFIQRICTVNGFHKRYKQTDNIILKIFVITNRDNVILIRRERRIFTGIPFATSISKSIHIQRVTTEHTTYCIGNKAFYFPFNICFSYGNRTIFECSFITFE